MAGMTNRGKARLLEGFFRNAYKDKDGNPASFPTTWKVGLYTFAATDPGADDDLFFTAREPTNGGYASGGLNLERSSIGWDTLTEDDTNDKGIIKGKDIVFSAVGTSLGPVQWALLTDDAATIGNRQLFAFWEIDAAGVTVSAGQSLTLIDLTIELRDS